MVKVTIDQGTLVGGKCKTESGFEYFEFLQIPYAKPPVGDLRFKSPQPPEPWIEEKIATFADENKTCYQFDMLLQKQRGSEDCLYLNVYTPKLPLTESTSLPVMVYIHGGGFVAGNGTLKSEGGPDFFLEHNVVIVSINYRLGVFGFLSLDIPEAAGNMGLKDQVMALKWVQKNIDKFGGNKDNVTLYGISAGGASIEYLIVSPLSRGLFHKAIPQSGSTLNPWAFELNIKDLSLKLVQELNYQGSLNDGLKMYEYLLNCSTESIGETAFKISNIMQYKGFRFGFVPTIEKDFENGDEFLTENPYNILKEGRFNKVPVLRGFCSNEGLIVMGMKHHDFQELVNVKKFTDFWWYPQFSDDVKEQYNTKLAKAYLDTNKKDVSFAVDFFGDTDFTSGIWIGTKLMVKHNIPVYLYEFAYDGDTNIVKKAFNVNYKGACHGDDTGYTLKMGLFPNDLKLSDEDKVIKNRISKMWTDFAKTGNPTPVTSQLTPIKWPVFDNDQQYLVIDKDLRIASKYQPDRMAIFEEMYENEARRNYK